MQTLYKVYYVTVLLERLMNEGKEKKIEPPNQIGLRKIMRGDVKHICSEKNRGKDSRASTR